MLDKGYSQKDVDTLYSISDINQKPYELIPVPFSKNMVKLVKDIK